MKIGILTHHYVNNFGAFLQTYALQEALKQTFPGDEIVVIDYRNLKHFAIGTAGWFRFRKYDFWKGWREKIKLPGTFRRERKKWLNLTKRCYTSAAVEKLGLDLIVFGSDEIWNYKDYKANDKIKFGAGLTGRPGCGSQHRCSLFVAYAPSVGQSYGSQCSPSQQKREQPGCDPQGREQPGCDPQPEENIPSYVRDGLKRFDILSARDDGTEELVLKITGRRPCRVLDPTFLVDFPCCGSQPDCSLPCGSQPDCSLPYGSQPDCSLPYGSQPGCSLPYGSQPGGSLVAEPPEIQKLQKPYLLFYYCDGLPEAAYQAIRKYADDNGYDIYGAGECNKYFSALTVNLTPFAWVGMFRNAAYVFTGTFHGVVFSILNRRQFRVYATIGSRIRKIRSLLSEFAITGREFLPDAKIELDDAIDYEKVWQIVEDRKKASLDYLQQIGDFSKGERE